MKRFICTAIFAILISGCQTVDDFVGTGPITLSSAVEDHFKSKYLAGPGPAYYVIPSDGRNAYYSYCPSGEGTCQFGAVALDAIARCERDTGQKCYVFAEGDQIVWKGPVTFRDMTSSERAWEEFKSKTGKDFSALDRLSDDEICQKAIDKRIKTAAWSTLPELKIEVAIAQTRGLTPEKCWSLIH